MYLLTGVSDKIAGLAGVEKRTGFPACRTAPLSPFRQSSAPGLAFLSRLEPTFSVSPPPRKGK